MPAQRSKRRIWRWQRQNEFQKDSTAAPEGLIAHTDYDPWTDWQLQRERRFARPNHAMEGALASLPGLARSLDGANVENTR